MPVVCVSAGTQCAHAPMGRPQHKLMDSPICPHPTFMRQLERLGTFSVLSARNAELRWSWEAGHSKIAVNHPQCFGHITDIILNI